MRHVLWVTTSLMLSCVPQVNDLPCGRDENCPGTLVCVCAVCVEADAGVRASCSAGGSAGGSAAGGGSAGGRVFDAGGIDAGADAGSVDAGDRDAGALDAGTSTDAGPADAGPADAGELDAGVDAGACPCGVLEVCVSNACLCTAGAARENGRCVPVLESLTVSQPQGRVPLAPVFDPLTSNFSSRMRFDASVTISATSIAPDASISLANVMDASVPYTTVQSTPVSSVTVKLSLGGVDRLYAVSVERNFPVQTSFKAQAGAGLSADGRSGSSIAVSNDGNVLVVGSPGANRADVFVRNATQWLGPYALIPSVALDPNDDYGRSVATNDDGTTIVVGAPGDDGVNNNDSNSGTAYSFRRVGTGITGLGALRMLVPRANDGFGAAVSVSGNGTVLLVGVPGDDSGPDGGTNTDSGAAVLFVSGSLQRVLKAPNVGAGDAFGASVAVANDNWRCNGDNWCTSFCQTMACGTSHNVRLVIGAPFEDSASLTVSPMGPTDETAQNSGAAYVFDGTPFMLSPIAYLKRPTAQAGANFGASVSISRRWGAIAVGAPNDASGALGISTGVAGITAASTDATMPAAGSVTIFDSAFAIARYVKFTAPQPGDRLGASVAMGADQYVLVAGAPGANGSSGLALHSLLTSNPMPRVLVPPFPDSGDEFGASVAISGFILTFVGSAGEDSALGGINTGPGLSSNTLPNSGAVFLHVD